MRERLSSLTTLMVPSSASSTSSTPTIASISATKACIVPSTTAHAALKVFDEMPSPNSWQETHGTAPDYRSGHQNPIQSSCLSNLSEKNLGGMPQSYGFSNLNRQSIILADGTERSYFTLPADYPSKQATPQMSPSAVANIAVTAQLPVEAKEACLTAFCCSKTNSIADSETMFVHDVQPPTAVQDDHKVVNKMHISDVFEEEKQEVDDLDKCFHKASENAFSEHLLRCFRKAPENEQTSANVLDYSLEQEQNDEKAVGNVHQPREPQWNALLPQETRKEWDPGDIVGVLQNTVLQSMGGQVDCLNPLSLTIPWDPGLLVMHSWVTRNSTRTTRDAVGSKNFSLLSSLASYRECTENHLANKELMEHTSTKVAALTWHSSLHETPLILLLSRTTFTWDPGVLTIIGMMLDKYAVSHEIQLIQWSAEFLFLSSTACMQYIAPNGVYSVLHATCFLLQRAAHLSQGNCLCSLYCNSVLNTEYCTERMQWDPGVKISLYNGLNILTIWAATDKQLYCTHIPELEARETAMHYCQMFEKCIGVSSQLYWHEDINLSGISLWLIHFLPP